MKILFKFKVRRKSLILLSFFGITYDRSTATVAAYHLFDDYYRHEGMICYFHVNEDLLLCDQNLLTFFTPFLFFLVFLSFQLHLVKNPGEEIKFRTSQIGILCTLVHVEHADASKSDDDIILTNKSPSSDYIITPVSSAYGKYWWELVQGPFIDLIKIRECTNKKCMIKFQKPGRYFLLSYQHQLKSFEKKLARFFIKSTFGPTRDMIKNFMETYGTGNKSIVNWVKDQMTLVPPTNHREYFRSHAVNISKRNTISDRGIAVQHPCAPYSRWRKYAFEHYDAEATFEVKEFEGRYLVIVRGVATTIMDSFESTDGKISGAGSYKFCKYILHIVV